MRLNLLSRTTFVVFVLSAVSCSQARSAIVVSRDAGTLQASVDGGARSDGETDEQASNNVSANSGSPLDAGAASRDQKTDQDVDASTVLSSDAAARGSNSDDDAGAGLPSPPSLCTACGACEEVQQVVSAMHTTMPVTYVDPPPSSGPHNPCWASWGLHEGAIVPPERWVHNLEHGGIVYLYNCAESCEAERAVLAKLVATRGHAVLTAYPALPSRFAVVSWGHRLVSDCMDEEAFDTFHVRNAGHGPELNMSPPNPMCPP